MADFNEGKSLDAVVRVLERCREAKRTILLRDTPATRGVELVCEIGGQRYAMEHTRIEPFPDNQRDNIAFARVFDDGFESEARDLLKQHLAYTVAVDVYAFDGNGRKELAGIRQRLLAWIRASIPQLPEPGEFPQAAVHGEPPATPVRVRLACHRSHGLGGRLITERFAPPTLEQLRDERLLKALRDKGPKLKIAKSPGTATVLVLENGDIALTNEGILSEAIERLGRDLPYMPDEIFLVGTYTGERFFVTQLRSSGQACLFMGADGASWIFDAETLDEI